MVSPGNSKPLRPGHAHSGPYCQHARPACPGKSGPCPLPSAQPLSQRQLFLVLWGLATQQSTTLVGITPAALPTWTHIIGNTACTTVLVQVTTIHRPLLTVGPWTKIPGPLRSYLGPPPCNTQQSHPTRGTCCTYHQAMNDPGCCHTRHCSGPHNCSLEPAMQQSTRLSK